MEICKSGRDLRARVQAARALGQRIGFVPTMGYLHAGHTSLIQAAAKSCDFVVASIFVNPLQFGPTEDFSVYPRNPEEDARIAENSGVDVLFMPTTEEMYPQSPVATVTLRHIQERLCGRSRPGHFEGVATVVAKLFNLVQPQAAFFGQKDAQQLAVIRRLVQDLNYDVEVVACPIVRESDGLAMSSRNVYLSPADRQLAPVLYQALSAAKCKAEAGESEGSKLVQGVIDMIQPIAQAQIDYVELVDPNSMEPVSHVVGPSLLALAVRFGKTRLIDNIILCPLSSHSLND